MDILKIGFLFLGIWFTLINTTRIMNKVNLPASNLLYQAIGITGFIVLQFNLY